MSHRLQTKTFTHLTYCDACKQLIWGIMKQGVHCSECGRTYHNRCGEIAYDCPNSLPERFLDDESRIESKAENYLRSLQQLHDASVQSNRNYSDSKRNAGNTWQFYDMMDEERKKRIRERSTVENILAIITSRKFQKMVADAATSDQYAIEKYISNQIPLNPQVTTRNFTRFISRCGPVFAFRDSLILLIGWHNRVNTFISLIIYCLLCLYPKFLFTIPEFILVYLILYKYFQTHRKSKQKRSSRLFKKSQSTTINGNDLSTMNDNLSDKDKRRSTTDIPSTLFPFNITSLFQASSEESPEYVRNLQNIQNSMGEFADAYDWITTRIQQYDWSSDEDVSKLLQYMFLVCTVLSIILHLIPVKVIFMTLGLTVYISNTQFMKYMMNQLRPYMIQSIKRRMNEYNKIIMDKDPNESKEISVYQNEKWSHDKGFVPFNDALCKPWSDYSGRIGGLTLDDILPPTEYEWDIESEWTVDTHGPWINDYLGIEIIVLLDKDGWHYGDHEWNIREREGQYMTRRRHWTRKCVKIQKTMILDSK